MYETAIAFSVLISFVLSDTLGLLTGGMISAGYLSLYVLEPLRLAATLLLAVLLFFAARGLSHITILYGRRRFMLLIVLSLLAAWLLERGGLSRVLALPQDIRVIGRIVPGLIANDMYKQGILRTLAGVALAGALVRLALMLVQAL